MSNSNNYNACMSMKMHSHLSCTCTALALAKSLHKNTRLGLTLQRGKASIIECSEIINTKIRLPKAKHTMKIYPSALQIHFDCLYNTHNKQNSQILFQKFDKNWLRGKLRADDRAQNNLNNTSILNRWRYH